MTVSWLMHKPQYAQKLECTNHDTLDESTPMKANGAALTVRMYNIVDNKCGTK